MKRKTFVTVFLFTLSAFTTMSLFAVDLSCGVKGGVNLATFGGDDSYQDGAYKCKYKIGFNTGLFASISLIKAFTLQSAILLSSKGTKVELDGLEGYEYDSLYYVEIPLVLKVYPLKQLSNFRLNIFTGPYLAIDVLNRYRTTDEVKDFYQLLGVETKGEYENVRTLDYGLLAGLGADIGRILLEVSWSKGMASTDDSVFEYHLENCVLLLMLGYRCDFSLAFTHLKG